VFEALAVLLLTPAVLALASLEVLVLLLADPVFKCSDVPLKDVSDGGSALLWELVIVVAGIWLGKILVALTGWPTHGFVAEALTVELKALCILTLAALAGCLIGGQLLFLKLLLSDG
jgi:hypothetical protein